MSRYNVKVVTLDTQPKFIPFNIKYVDVITKYTTADISKVKVSIDGGPQVPLNDFVPIPIPVRQMVLNWEASETGKKIAFLLVDSPITKVKQSVTLLTDESGIKAGIDSIDSKVDVNLSTRASESTLSGIKAQTDKLQFDTDNDLYITGRVKEGSPVEYTTTDTLSDVTTLDISMFDKVTILIKNKGSNDADVAVYTKVNADGEIEYEEVATSLSGGDVMKVSLDGKYAKAIIRAKSTTSGSSTTIRVEWIGGKA